MSFLTILHPQAPASGGSYVHSVAPLGGTVVESTATGTTVDLVLSIVGNYTSDGTLT